MELVKEALKQANLGINDLPSEIKQRISNLESMIKSYNVAYDSFEEDDEHEEEEIKDLEQMEKDIEEQEKELVEDINEFAEEQQVVAEQTQQQTHSNATGTEPKKEKSSVGWLIFGGIALVATLGAVNLLKNK